MKVLNLRCAHQHDFEGWFASESDFHQQLQGGLLECPLCGDTQVQKMLSAPRLNLGRSPDKPARAGAGDEQQVEVVHAAPGSEHQGQLLTAFRQLMQQTEDVGERFADEARAMHQGDKEARSIRGQTTPEVALELIEEGIAVVPIPMLPVLKETLQ